MEGRLPKSDRQYNHHYLCVRLAVPTAAELAMLTQGMLGLDVLNDHHATVSGLMESAFAVTPAPTSIRRGTFSAAAPRRAELCRHCV
jgi:hypothetical protein